MTLKALVVLPSRRTVNVAGVVPASPSATAASPRKKYGVRLDEEKGNKGEIVNNLMTSAEWDESLKCGAAHALDCGFGVDGIKALYDCINKMPKRPVWTQYFLPEKANVSKVKILLEKYEKDYFQGKLTY